MATIKLNFHSRHPQHIGEISMSRIEYVIDRFEYAREIATPSCPSYVDGLVSSSDIKRIHKHTSLVPIEKQATKVHNFFHVTYEIGRDTVMSPLKL